MKLKIKLGTPNHLKMLSGRHSGSPQRLKISPQRSDMFREGGGMLDVIKGSDSVLQILGNVALRSSIYITPYILHLTITPDFINVSSDN